MLPNVEKNILEGQEESIFPGGFVTSDKTRHHQILVLFGAYHVTILKTLHIAYSDLTRTRISKRKH